MEEKENFYLFLDIDGVMWDWPWRFNELKKGKITSGIFPTSFNCDSVKALNELINYISNKYECNLVISSSWRTVFNLAVSALKKNNVNMPKFVDRTPLIIKKNNRGEEILEYLKDKEYRDFLIIDDQYRDFNKHFSKDKLIKTNIYDESLRMHHVENWINQRENNLTQKTI